MKNGKRKGEKGRIYSHRFVPDISTSSKVFKDGKTKARSRRELNRTAREYEE